MENERIHPATSRPATPASAPQAPPEASDDPVFAAEQRHLAEVYAKLQTMARDLAAKLEQNSRDAAADKLAMCDELSVNLASYADAMETYADFAAVNRVIDAYNISQSVDAEKLASIGLLLEQPYFAKIVLQLSSGDEPKELYLGVAGVSDDACRRLVVDWRSPVAEVYYNQDLGPTSYRANGRTIHADLKLRRQFDVRRDVLNAYFDTSVAIQDSLLLASLSKRRSARMRDITATIQKEQNQVIRHEDVPALLVNGIAGSGKTSVLMQRIAYLFYRRRDDLDPSQVFLITPNSVFKHYVAGVLPDLGERNPETLTWADFLERLMPPDRTGGSADVPLARLDRIDEACEGLALEQHDFKDVRAGGDRLLSVAQIMQVAGKFAGTPVGPRLITLMREELLKRLDARCKQIAGTDAVLDELSAMTPDEQLARFHETFDPNDEDDVRQRAQQFVAERYAGAREAVENDDWLRIDRIGMRLLGAENLLPVEWLYVKMALTGLGNPDAKYVMIDEVQDYTTAQLAVLARYFRRARFLLLGDENQAINPGTASFSEVRKLFVQVRGACSECRLMTSYRSAPEITALFSGLLPADERGRVSSIQRDDEPPSIVICNDEERWEAELRRAVRAAAEEDGLSAVIAPDGYAVKLLRKRLGGDAPEVVDAHATLPAQGVVLTSLKLAKGLEFDHVIVPDASERVFPADDLSRRRLYTTVSRATRRLTMLSRGPVTPLLP